MAQSEFTLINRYFKRVFETHYADSVALGIGDDAALLNVAQGHQLVVSVDTLVSGVHFPENSNSFDIAERALRVNLSDLAAMAATPLWFTLALTLPKTWSQAIREDWVKGFSEGLASCAKQYSCHLVGGDTTSGALSVTIQVMGQVEKGRALRRDGAREGDFIWVTNSLGDGAGALAYLKGELTVGREHAEYFKQRFFKPVPRLFESALIKSYASSAIDVSDGLIADLNHICESSHVSAKIDVSSLPFSKALNAVDLKCARQWALSGGDDYELVFTVPAENMQSMKALQSKSKLHATVIGRMTAGGGVHCNLNGKEYKMESNGFEHF